MSEETNEETQAPEETLEEGTGEQESEVQIGLGPGGVVVNVRDASGQEAGAYISPDEAWRIAGQLISTATVVLQVQYSQVARAKAAEAEFLAKTGGGRIIVPGQSGLR